MGVVCALSLCVLCYSEVRITAWLIRRNQLNYRTTICSWQTVPITVTVWSHRIYHHVPQYLRGKYQYTTISSIWEGTCYPTNQMLLCATIVVKDNFSNYRFSASFIISPYYFLDPLLFPQNRQQLAAKSRGKISSKSFFFLLPHPLKQHQQLPKKKAAADTPVSPSNPDSRKHTDKGDRRDRSFSSPPPLHVSRQAVIGVLSHPTGGSSNDGGCQKLQLQWHQVVLEGAVPVLAARSLLWGGWRCQGSGGRWGSLFR